MAWSATGWQRFTYFPLPTLRQLRSVIPAVCVLLISGCGGSGSSNTVTIGGTVTGLLGTAVLQNNAGDNLTVTADGAFTFATPIPKGAPYAVTILTQPAGPACAVAIGSGTSTVNVTNVSVTCTVDPATVFVPISAEAYNTPTPEESTGLFVVSTNSPGDPPIQITTQTIRSFGLLSRYTLGPQGRASVANPYAIMYTTIDSSSGDHVWSLRLSGTNTLTPTQLSNLTIPYTTQSNSTGETYPVQYCVAQLMAKNLADPSSAFLVLALPTDATQLCAGSQRWLLIRATDGPTTTPVSLPELNDWIQPLYRPDGTLAGLLATDTAHNLNLYPDETFTNPKVLLTNADVFSLTQEPQPAASYAVSADPTYGFLLVLPTGSVAVSFDVYHVDYSGAISAKLYTEPNDVVERLVDSHSLYYVESSEQTLNTNLVTVGRISAGGGPALTLASTIESPGIPSIVGLSGSHLVLQRSAVVLAAPTDTTGSFTTISNGIGYDEDVAIADGDVFLTGISGGSGPLGVSFSSAILDVAGNVLQPPTAFSAFIASGAPIMQVKDIPAGSDMRGGQLFALDLSTPASPNPVPLTTATGAPYTVPPGTNAHVAFKHLTPTISIAEDEQRLPNGPLLIYNQSTGVIATVTIPNSTCYFLMQPD